MLGMNATTGEALGGLEHLQQSVRDILATPYGTRLMRRNYGSRLMQLVDRPMDAALIADIQAAVLEALNYYEDRLRVSRLQVEQVQPGQISISLEGYYLVDNRAIRLDNIII